MSATPAFDHVALTVPNLDEQVDRLASEFSMEVLMRSEYFALVVDPESGVRFELSRSPDDDVHLRHLGFRVDDVDTSHTNLTAAGMEPTQPPHRDDLAGMYTSSLQQRGGVEVQLVTYD